MRCARAGAYTGRFAGDVYILSPASPRRHHRRLARGHALIWLRFLGDGSRLPPPLASATPRQFLRLTRVEAGGGAVIAFAEEASR